MVRNLPIRIVLLVLVAILANGSSAPADVKVAERSGRVSIENAFVKINYDLSKGVYDAVDLRDNSICIKDAYARWNDYASNSADFRHVWESRLVSDSLGKGKKLIVKSRGDGRPVLVFEVSIYDGLNFVVLAAGIENTTEQVIQLKRIEPIAGGIAFEGFDLTSNFSMLDGNGGGEHTAVTHGSFLRSRNNLLVTFGTPGDNRSMVLGGLTYNDFEKFAETGPSRRTELKKRTGKLLCYLDLGVDETDGRKNSPMLRLLKGTTYTFGRVSGTGNPVYATVVYDDKEVVLVASGLNSRKQYQLGFSWWDDRRGRIMSVSTDAGIGTKKHVLLDKQSLPAGGDKQAPEERLLTLPPQSYRTGKMRILFSNDSGPNALVSEVWLREGEAPAGEERRSVSESSNQGPSTLDIKLYALDPVGKRVDPGVRYMPKDRFYLDFTTDNPFEALEKYGLNIRAAQEIKVNLYDFPTVCLWYAHHSGYGGGLAYNNTPGAVAEIDRINKRGFLKYSRAAVRLVPDCYNTNNQQGWWDDEHFRMHGSTNLGPFEGGQYAEPYETSVKWGKAMTERGGIPLTYFQTSFRSEDYAEKFPQHMLFNKTHAWKAENLKRPEDDEKFWGSAWARSGRMWGYDYTDDDFLKHMREVYANLRAGGIKGLMFDYPSSGWASKGGMDDPYYTTARAYRKIFKLAYDGLGPDCYIHERNIQRGSDITLGLVASQRTWGDTDRISPQMISRSGLRWYKNRVVVSYDMDAKNIARPKGRDTVRGLLTMAYVASGRLLLATSFGQMSDETLFDMSRIYPFHTNPQSARPVDAFINKYPVIYDFPVNSQWHQVTFYNTSQRDETTIGVNLAGNTAFGAMGLDATESYYVYDFWNDRLASKLSGSERLEQQLRPSEARMMSVHQVLDHPQFISTNRHIMQGYVDMIKTRWIASKRQLVGTSKVIGDETYKVTIATNGCRPKSATASGAHCELRLLGNKDGLIELSINRPENGVVEWVVTFTPDSSDF